MMLLRNSPSLSGRGSRGGCARPRAQKTLYSLGTKRAGGIEAPARPPTPFPSLEREGLS
jgi:hypothetical protein